jgi:hypothetical protein
MYIYGRGCYLSPDKIGIIPVGLMTDTGRPQSPRKIQVLSVIGASAGIAGRTADLQDALIHLHLRFVSRRLEIG